MKTKRIGENIRKYRKEKGYTQKEFAEKIGRAYGTVRRYEAGRIGPSIGSISIIANALEVSIIDILK